MTLLWTYPVILQILIVVVVEGAVVVVAQGRVVDDADLARICKNGKKCLCLSTCQQTFLSRSQSYKMIF